MGELHGASAANRLSRFVLSRLPAQQSAELWINSQMAARAPIECPTTGESHPVEFTVLPGRLYLE